MTLENDISELISESFEKDNTSTPSEQDSTVSEKFHWDEKYDLEFDKLKSKKASEYGKLEFELIEFKKILPWRVKKYKKQFTKRTNDGPLGSILDKVCIVRWTNKKRSYGNVRKG